MVLGFTASAVAQDRPNILVVWGDDIGQSNISAVLVAFPASFAATAVDSPGD